MLDEGQMPDGKRPGWHQGSATEEVFNAFCYEESMSFFLQGSRSKKKVHIQLGIFPTDKESSCNKTREKKKSRGALKKVIANLAQRSFKKGHR